MSTFLIHSIHFYICSLKLFKKQSFSRQFNFPLADNFNTVMYYNPQLWRMWGRAFVNIFILWPTLVFAQVDPFDPQSHVPSKLETEVFESLDRTNSEGKIAHNFSPFDSFQLPLILDKGPNWLIGIDSLSFSDGRGLFSVIASLTIPGTNRRLAFKASGIDLNPRGLNASTISRLYLASDVNIPIHDKLILQLPGGQNNYIEFSCQGFEGIHLQGALIFHDAILLPEPSLQMNTSKYVRASVEVHTSDLHNILLGVEISPFQVNGLAGLGFEVKKAYWDMSDIANPTGIRFPASYHSGFYEQITLWRGLYIEEVNILLPEEFVSKTGRLKIQAKDLIIDRQGLSGEFSIQKEALVSESFLGNWPCSLDRISLRLANNKLVGGMLAGKLGVPFLNREQISFQAELEQIQGKLNLRFALVLDTQREYRTPFGAKLYLDPGSSIGFETRDDKIIPQMVLHGRMELNQDVLQLKNIRFENLTITGASPYLIGGSFSLGGEEPIQLSHFRGKTNEIRIELFQGQFALTVPISVNLMNAEDKGISAESLVRVLFSVREVREEYGEQQISKQVWKFDDIRVEEVYLNSTTGALSFEGKVAFRRNDPVFGNGFYGNIQLGVNGIFKKGIQAQAQFGSKPGFRYWQVDFNAPVKNIPIGAGPCSINGIRGGASYRMKSPSFDRFNYNLLNQATTQTQEGLGQYLPDSTIGLELKAGVSLILAQEKVFNADALFRMSFRKAGGLREIFFNGNGYFFTPLAKRARGNEPDSRAPAYANLKMQYDFVNRIFHANCQTFLHVNGVMTGTGPNGLVGDAVLHFSPDDWYMYIGRPRQMFGVDVLRVLSTKAYFMIGTQVEDLPLPPPALQEIFGSIDLDFMRDENALSSGRGFAAGLHVQASANPHLGPFYARLQVGGGVDLMLRRYSNAFCKNRQDKQLGIQGWYGSGQAYVFMDGSVGVKLGRKKRFDFLRLGAGALLQAKLPNPTWMRGALAGKFSILGGLVKGRFRLKVNVGEACELVQEGNELGDVFVIGDIEPSLGSQDISVFTAPQIAFNMPVEKEIKLINNLGEVKLYRVIIDELHITQQGQKLDQEILWNEAHDLATLQTLEVLPENASLKIHVKLHWEKKESGVWKAFEFQGQVDYESKMVDFHSGTAPNFIPKENIAYSYPQVHQYNFYPQEYPKGYIQLKRGQSYLFYESDSLANWRYELRFTKKDSSFLSVAAIYSINKAQLSFEIPPNLESESLFNLQIVRVPHGSAQIDSQVKRSYTNTQFQAEDTQLSIRENRLDGSTVRQGTFELLSYYFRSSKYKRFLEKIESLEQLDDVQGVSPANTRMLGKVAHSQEAWDKAELQGINQQTALIISKAEPQVNWISNTIYPWLYKEYPLETGLTISEWRQLSNSQNPMPLDESVVLANFQAAPQVLDFPRQASLTDLVPSQSGDMYIQYNLSYYAYRDFYELRNKAYARLIHNNSIPSPRIKRLLSLDPTFPNSFVDLERDQYPVRLEYTLPGINQVTSAYQTKIRY